MDRGNDKDQAEKALQMTSNNDETEKLQTYKYQGYQNGTDISGQYKQSEDQYEDKYNENSGSRRLA